MALDIPKFKRPESELRFSHNMYDLIGSTLQTAYYNGKVRPEDIDYFMNNTLKLDLDYSVGDYGIRAQYNAYDPIHTGGKLDYKIGVRFPINIEGI